MAIRILRLLEYVYETAEQAIEDRKNWGVQAIRRYKQQQTGLTAEIRSVVLPMESLAGATFATGIEQTKDEWAVERQDIINKLREVCKDWGDNDCEDNLSLCDVIEKHLARNLWDVYGDDKEDYDKEIDMGLPEE